MATENVITIACRLAFPEVFEAKASQEGGAAKFSVNLLFPKDGSSLIPSLGGSTLMDLRKLLFTACKEKWGEDRQKWPANLRNLDFKTYLSPNGKDGWPIRSGDDVDWEGYKGNIFLRASSQYQPGLVDAKLKPIIDRNAVFGGLIVRCQLNAYTYDTNGNKGVTFGLNNLQILKDDGTVFSGREKAEDVFGAFGEAEPAMAAATDDAW
jgi:hypothetical protein